MTTARGAIQDTKPPGPPELLVTKFHPPAARDHTVHRERLVDRLRDSASFKLTLIAAPAGSGKTTLLASWREIEAATKPFAWVSLDEDDNDTVRLWAHIVAALRRASPVLEESISPELVSDVRLLEVALGRLMNTLADQGETVLVLDDFHRLSPGPARDSIRWVVDHAPASLQLVLSTRTEPAMPLAALRAHAELLEVRASETRFTFEEADALLNGRLGLDLTREDVDHLVERTEGWAAGLYLAALSLAGIGERRAGIGQFGPTHSYVADFLTEEVLDASDPATRELMLRCSVLERFCGPLCDAVLDTEGAADLLRALSRTNLFLVPLDDHGEWFRFHHFFGEMLRMELERREPASSATLHSRAHEWHRRHGTTDEAIDHALAARAFAEAGELIEAAWIHYANAARYATVLAWLHRIPDEVLHSSTRLLLVKAWVLSMCGRSDEAAGPASVIEQLGVEDGPLADGLSSVEASLAMMRAVFPDGDVGARLKNARRALELEGPGTPWRCMALWGVGNGLLLSGESEQARPWLEEAAKLAPASEQWIVAGSSLAYLSLIAGERGDLERQRALAEQAVALARERDTYEVACEIQLAYAASPAACRTLAEAMPYVERGIAGYRAWGERIDTAHGLYVAAVVLLRFGEHTRASDPIAEAESIVASCPDPGVLPARLAALKRLPHSHARPRNDALSEREVTVLRLLSGPLSERDIGRELYLSHNTVHSHVRSIYRKLDVSSRKAAIRRARELSYLKSAVGPPR